MASYLRAGRGGPARPGTNWAGETRLPPPRGAGRQAGSGSFSRAAAGGAALAAAAGVSGLRGRCAGPSGPAGKPAARAANSWARRAGDRCRLPAPLPPPPPSPPSPPPPAPLPPPPLLPPKPRGSRGYPLPPTHPRVQTQCEPCTRSLPQGRGPCDPRRLSAVQTPVRPQGLCESYEAAWVVVGRSKWGSGQYGPDWARWKRGGCA